MVAATLSLVSAKAGVARPARRTSLKVSAAAYNGQYAEELVKTAVSSIIARGAGIAAGDGSASTPRRPCRLVHA